MMRPHTDKGSQSGAFFDAVSDIAPISPEPALRPCENAPCRMGNRRRTTAERSGKRVESNGRKSGDRASPSKGARGRELGAREAGAQGAPTGTAKLPNPAEHPTGHLKDGRRMAKSWKDADVKGCGHPPKKEGGSVLGSCARQS